MRLLSLLIIFGVLWHESGASCITDGDNSGISAVTVDKISDAMMKYTLNLYKTMVADEKTKTENIFTSPYSMWSALSVAYLGARGKTSEEFRTLLALQGLQKSGVEEQSKKLETKVKSNEGDVFTVANKIAFDSTWAKIRQCIVQDPSIPVEEVNFAGDPDTTRKALNAWAKNQTNGKIEDLLPEGSIDGYTALVILNAVYFKGEWKHKFKPDPSNGQIFISSTGEASTVPMMTLTREMNFKMDMDLGVQAVELLYASGKYSMVMMLPNSDQTVDALVGKLDNQKLKNLLNSFSETKVKLIMPKFKIEKSYKLNELLKKLGLEEVFESADISGIVEASAPLHLSSVIHKAFIEVNEEGAEAAAATAVEFATRTGPMRLKFNRPFLFLLKSTETNAVLFMGVVRKL